MRAAAVTFAPVPEAKAPLVPSHAPLDAAALEQHVTRTAAPAAVPTDIGIHPAANLFPMQSMAEIEDLANSIKREGQHDAIIMFEGKILDGRNRWVACQLKGITPRMQEWDGSGGTPLQFVWNKNIRRRQLTPAQRAAIALEAKPLFDEEAKQRQLDAGEAGRLLGGAPRPPGDTPTPRGRDEGGRAIVQAAKSAQAGIGATKILHKASKTAPEVVAMAKNRQLNVAEAGKLATLPKKDRVAAVQRIEGGELAKAVLSELVPAPPKPAAPQPKPVETAAPPVLPDTSAYREVLRELETWVHLGRVRQLLSDAELQQVLRVQIAELEPEAVARAEDKLLMSVLTHSRTLGPFANMVKPDMTDDQLLDLLRQRIKVGNPESRCIGRYGPGGNLGLKLGRKPKEEPIAIFWEDVPARRREVRGKDLADLVRRLFGASAAR